MNRLIVIVGPTASGKSDLAMRLAMQFNCEIISGDSMCVYRGMDIGTAKPSPAERLQIPHHLIDIREPGEDFSVVDFQRLAGEAVEAVNKKGKIPILAGGTGLYVQALLEGYNFSQTPKTELRNTLSESMQMFDSSLIMHEKLSEVDPQAAARIHPHDRKRIVRALEVATSEQKTVSCDKTSDSPTLLYDCIILGLSMERQKLYSRINDRVDRMVEAGLVDEVSALIKRGLPPESTALQAIGYKELADCIRGLVSLADAVELVKQSSRRYAKRQLTWFRRMPYIQWIEQSEGMMNRDEAYRIAERRVAEKFAIK